MAPDKNELRADEAIRIIEASAKVGVATLQWGDLKVQFLGMTPEVRETGSPFGYPVVPGSRPAPVAALTENQHQKLSEEALREAQEELRREQIALLKIEDPVLYEKLVRDGDIDDGVDGTDDESGDGES